MNSLLAVATRHFTAYVVAAIGAAISCALLGKLVYAYRTEFQAGLFLPGLVDSFALRALLFGMLYSLFAIALFILRRRRVARRLILSFVVPVASGAVGWQFVFYEPMEPLVWFLAGAVSACVWHVLLARGDAVPLPSG